MSKSNGTIINIIIAIVLGFLVATIINELAKKWPDYKNFINRNEGLLGIIGLLSLIGLLGLTEESVPNRPKCFNTKEKQDIRRKIKLTRTVEEGFKIFHGWLTPTGGETEAAKKHRASIKDCLETNFGMTRFFRSGSFGNGTNISGYSDVDYFAEIPANNLTQDSAYSIRKIRDVLEKRFPNTGVTIRTPAIVIPFGSDTEKTEVVPAYYIKKENGYETYDIADGKGGWMKSGPDAHNAYVDKVDGNLGNKVKPLIRFIKAWKYYNSVEISSFYLELRTTKYALSETSIVYSIDLKNILKLLYDNQLSAIQDPMGVSGLIYPCSSEAKKYDALSKLETALVRAEKARNAEIAEKISDAFYWWDILFNYRFPTY